MTGSGSGSGSGCACGSGAGGGEAGFSSSSGSFLYSIASTAWKQTKYAQGQFNEEHVS